MHNKEDIEKKKRRAWRRNPVRGTFRFKGQIRNILQPVQMSPKSKRDLHGIAGMWLTSTSLTTDKTEKDRLSLPMGIAKDRNGPLTGRKPGSKKKKASTSLKTDKTEKDLLSLPLGIANDRNGPLTGRRPGSTKSVILTPCGNEMGDAQGVAKKRRATRRERDRYCKSLYWKQKVYNINYPRMQNARPCVQV